MLLLVVRTRNFNEQDAERAISQLPNLLCTQGPPPATMMGEEPYTIFAWVCMDLGVQGLRGQLLPGYAQAVERVTRGRAKAQKLVQLIDAGVPYEEAMEQLNQSP